MSEILLIVGFVLFLIGGIGFLIASFRAGILWGLGVLLIPFVSLVFLIVHWQTAKKSFLLQVFGGFVMMFPIVFPSMGAFPAFPAFFQ